MELKFEDLTEQQQRRIAEEIVDSQREYLAGFVEVITHGGGRDGKSWQSNQSFTTTLNARLSELVDKVHACRDWQVAMIQAERAEHDPSVPRPCIAIPQPRRIRPIPQIPLNAVLVQSSGPALELDALDPFETM